MSNGKDNGGPAFPTRTRMVDASEGMTLRDYFAAKAMQELINPKSTSGWQWIRRRFGLPAVQAGATPESVSISAYAYADAMLKAREQ